MFQVYVKHHLRYTFLNTLYVCIKILFFEIKSLLLYQIYDYFLVESAMGVSLDKVDKKKADEYKNALYEMGSLIMYR